MGVDHSRQTANLNQSIRVTTNTFGHSDKSRLNPQLDVCLNKSLTCVGNRFMGFWYLSHMRNFTLETCTRIHNYLVGLLGCDLIFDMSLLLCPFFEYVNSERSVETACIRRYF